MSSTADFLGKGLFRKLSEQQVLTPYLEKSMLADSWPDFYTVKIDSSPYTGTGDGYFHPSTHALADARWLYYQLHPQYKDKLIQEKKSLTSMMTLAMGSALHAVVQVQFRISGLIEKEDIEVQLVNEKYKARGHMDWRIKKHPNGKSYAVEFKTRNSQAFEYRTKEPLDYWVAQLQLYMDWSGHEEGIILVLESGYPYRFKEFVIRRDEKLLKKIYDKWQHVRECIEANTPPKYCCAFNSQVMSSCNARFVCWLGEN